jgi:hypothetical protein
MAGCWLLAALLAGSLISWMARRLAGWLTGFLASWMARQMRVWVSGRLTGVKKAGWKSGE